MTKRQAILQFALIAFAALRASEGIAQIELKSRTLQPTDKTTTEFTQRLKASALGQQHALATLSRPVSPEERKSLEAAGLKLLQPIEHLSYRVRVDKALYTGKFKVPELNVSLIGLEPQDRVEPAIWISDFKRYEVASAGAKPANYVLNADGTVNLSVRMHATVADADSQALLKKHAVSVRKESDTTWIAVLRPSEIPLLAAEDSVQWIDAGPLPFLPENDITRATLGVDTLQNFNIATGQPAGLGGRGVTVAIFDKGVDETHGDFSGRIVADPLTHTHATHLAGTVAGSGALSNGTDSWGLSNGTVAYRWRGMAPLATLIDADQLRSTEASLHLDYVQNRGMALSLHSYKFSFDGAYGEDNQLRDSLIRGDATSGGSPVPGRLFVVSSGNDGDLTLSVGAFQKGYFALTKQVKNALMVGNWNNDRIATTSSLGPAHDGRIKPDVVAPGSIVKSAGYCPPSVDPLLAYCYQGATYAARQHFYREATGTSMAAAVTAGVLALALEQYATTYSVDIAQQPPLPSTLRALMIHTASDRHTNSVWHSNADGEVKPGVGPDFVTGWGLIEPSRAIATVTARRLLEDSLPATCHVRTYLFYMPVLPSLRVRATLAWDDVAADAAMSNTRPKLVNDLDLLLVSPSGARHYPWKLDQQARDNAGHVVPDASQKCGSKLRIARTFIPTSSPSTSNDSIPASGVPSAVRGRDHLNNVEVVEAANPTLQTGTWTVQVLGFNVAEGPQKFSLVGANFVPFHVHATALCQTNPALCAGLGLSITRCERLPETCDTHFSFPGNDRVRMQFTDRRQKLILPLDISCKHALNCPPCAANGTCTSYSVQASSPTNGPTAALYASDGTPVDVTIAGSGGHRRLEFTAVAGERYFVVLTPRPATALATDYDIKLRLY